ncbi:hypothetical protein [Azohydromonas sediminis]|uniref:hypothetical protein n=1 Tax=Azohydromonas sediminis TaxID=2259674 RepID=UPI0013C36D78|nr:hypothetical protein [Azohydromonas sediminis]
MTTNIPNLAGVATSNLVEQIGTGKFSASYINWSRTMALLREHAPGWQPELVTAPDGYVLHQAPVGAYLLIRFRNGDVTTPPVPQAVMDTRNAAIPIERITARDITDTHRRGVCMAAAFTFGLAYELWAKLPLESGYADAPPPPPPPTKVSPVPDIELPPQEHAHVAAVVDSIVAAWQEGSEMEAIAAYYELTDNDHKVAAWKMLAPHSKLRALLKANQPTAQAA